MGNIGTGFDYREAGSKAQEVDYTKGVNYGTLLNLKYSAVNLSPLTTINLLMRFINTIF